jgi:hypothetical protein
MVLVSQQELKLFFVLFGNVCLVSLSKHEEGVVPQNGQLSSLVLKAAKVLGQGIDDLPRQGILLIQQNSSHFTNLLDGAKTR